MGESKILINEKPVIYDGLFRTDELYGIFRRFMKERGYFLIELQNIEEVNPDGKQVIIKLSGTKQISEYAKRHIIVLIQIRKLKDREVVIDSHKQKFQHGVVECFFTANLLTDYKNKWEGSGFLYLVRTIMDKFVRKDIIHQAEAGAIKDCTDLQDEVKAYLNMTRFKVK